MFYRLAPVPLLPLQQLRGTSIDTVMPVSYGKIEFHIGFPVIPHIVAPQIFSRSDGAAGFSIERIAHGVKDGGFPCAGRTANEKERMIPQSGEIQILLACIRAESTDPESFRSHQSSSFRRFSHSSFM